MKYVLIFMAAVFAAGCNEGGKSDSVSRPAESGVSQNEKIRTRPSAADFTVSAIDGRTISLSSLKGKVVIVNFWATWCGPCVYEIPGLVKVYDKYKDRGLEIIGLSVDRSRSSVVKFASRKGINYPIAFADRDMLRAYGGIQAIPTTFFIDKNGKIADSVVGARDEAFFESEIKKLIQEGK
ncbi:MAG: TlpA family protein disulfide reductase [Elusimicrobia bacterium]|nr:TlpA family protein disulfide reductase [Elusimicrobiota bacterium]